MSGSKAADNLGNSADWMSKHGLYTGIIGSLIIAGSSGYHVNELVKGSYTDDNYSKYGISSVLLILVILEIVGWIQYSKNKKTDDEKAQKELFYYNLPIVIAIFIIIIIAWSSYTTTSNNRFDRYL